MYINVTGCKERTCLRQAVAHTKDMSQGRIRQYGYHWSSIKFYICKDERTKSIHFKSSNFLEDSVIYSRLSRCCTARGSSIKVLLGGPSKVGFVSYIVFIIVPKLKLSHQANTCSSVKKGNQKPFCSQSELLPDKFSPN